MNRLIKAFLVFLSVILASCIVINGIKGTTISRECMVIDKRYVPERTDVVPQIGADGYTKLMSVFHPEEFHVSCRADNQEVIDIETTLANYASVTNGQQVMVIEHIGHWLRFVYYRRMEP